MNFAAKEYKNICIKEMIEMMHIRGVSRALLPELEKWSDEVGNKRLEEYERLHEKYRTQLYTEPCERLQRKNKGKRKSPTLYWFVLLECGSMNWELATMNPGEFPEHRYYEILPKDIIQEMAEGLVAPDKVITRKNIHSAMLKKNMDLQYVYISKTCIMGTVTEYSRDLSHWKGDIEIAFMAYYNYRKKYPDEVLAFVNDFLVQLESGRLTMYEPEPNTGNTPDTAYPKYRDMLKIRPLPREKETAPRCMEPVLVESKPDDSEFINIRGILALARIPEFNKWLWLKLEEIKGGPLKKEIDAYNATKAYYRETMFSGCWKEGDEDKGKRPPYWFVITAHNSSHWSISEMDPLPPVFDSMYNIVPRWLYNLMINGEVINPSMVMTLSADFPPPLNIRIELQWVRCSPNCVMGKIHETDIERPTVPGAFYILDDYKKEMAADAVFNRLKRHMYRDPRVAETFIDTFINDMLPKLK
ncbi:MAG: hypothetical protein GY950_30455 [bacterium]|nr:hypothetical protein [bacterium]